MALCKTMTDRRRANHILSFAQNLDGGGVERALFRLARLWIARGRRVTLVLGSDVGPLAAELPAGIEIMRLNDANYQTMLNGAPRAVRAARPDIVFCPGNHYSAVAAWTRLMLAGASPPIVAKVSNALERRDHGGFARWGYRAWLGLHRFFLDAVVAMTPGMADEAARRMKLAPERIHVIPNPPTLPGEGRTTCLPFERFIVGVGRLAPQKRWDRALAALARIADRDIGLVLLGEGPERDALTRQAAALGIADRVTMPGHVADSLAVVERATVLTLTSDFEGVPGALREALCVGTPVVTTDSSVAVQEIVTRPEQGTIVAPDDADALVAALDHWIAPDRQRPAPLTFPGDPAGDYLALFDQLVAGPSASS